MIAALVSAMRRSALMKVALVLVVLLLLCIPLGQIRDLIAERFDTRNEAARELAQTYTGPQSMLGPVLVVPFTERWKEAQRDEKGKVIGEEERSKERIHLVFPDTFVLDGEMTPQMRYRGIFSIPFYTLQAKVQGRFAAVDAAALKHSERNSTFELKTPYVSLVFSDLRGIEGTPTLNMAGEALRFAQNTPDGGKAHGLLAAGIHAPLSGAALSAWRGGQPMDYALELALVGQEMLSIVPVAGDTHAHIRSPWAHPSFGGRFLAAQRSVTAQGFDAQWRVSSLVTSARDQVRAAVQADANDSNDAGGSVNARMEREMERASSVSGLERFEVSLIDPVNVYSMAMRAAKYGAMFIGLVLMAAFMFELFKKLRLHPVQYALVGLSIALFFLLLVALSEKIAFWQAYAAAAGASVLLLVAYFSAVLQGVGRGLSLGGFVAVLYAALYGLLASENNALLLGALLVFGMLATLMLATRKVDWYALRRDGVAAEPEVKA